MNARLLFSLFSILLLLPMAGAEERPNFLLLLSDDQGWNGLSCRMHPDLPESRSEVIETPNLARLAAGGMRFSAAYSPASVCSPTRISLQTGKSPAQCHWTKAAPVMTASDGFRLIPPSSRKQILREEVTIGEMLQSAGYLTAHYGKWHLGREDPKLHGYDESDGPTGNQHAAPFVDPNPVDIFGMGERAVAFMKRSQREKKPFFIQMSYHALHYPENATPAVVEKYQARMRDQQGRGAGKAALSEILDRGIGRLLAGLDELGLGGETYVIYLSDNGATSRGLLRGGKGGVWEGGIRVPFLIRGPGIPADSWSHQRVVGYDLYPTFCELAGIERAALPGNIEGGSITHLLRGEERPVKRPREELVFHFPHYQGDTPHSALLFEQWKIMHFYETGETQLYHLANDLAERRDLAAENPEIVEGLKEKLFTYLDEVDARMPEPNPRFDPKNPPSLRDQRGGAKGAGGQRGVGKGRKGEGTRRPAGVPNRS